MIVYNVDGIMGEYVYEEWDGSMGIWGSYDMQKGRQSGEPLLSTLFSVFVCCILR